MGMKSSSFITNSTSEETLFSDISECSEEIILSKQYLKRIKIEICDINTKLMNLRSKLKEWKINFYVLKRKNPTRENKRRNGDYEKYKILLKKRELILNAYEQYNK